MSNSIISTSGVGSGTPGTAEVPPTGSSSNNSGSGINIDIDGTPPDTMVFLGTNWKYLANNTRPSGWETTGYSDAAWPSGNGQLGYGDGDETTCIPSGGGGTLCNPTGTKYRSYYFRKTVNIVDPSSYADFTLGVFRDDGIVVYINGAEVYRNNMPGGVITHTTLASAAAPDDGNTLQTTNIPTSAFVAGNNVIAVEVHQNSATSSDLSFDLQLIANPITGVTFIPYGSSWKYLDINSRPAVWETTAYSDAAWPSGNAQLGYGDGDETTIVSYGPDANNKYITTYFRKTVTIANPSSFAGFTLNLIRDDGAVVYINGVEVGRDNIPAGPVSHTTLASSNIGGAAESTPVTFFIPPSYFVNGSNTIAVEIHQDDVTSSDLSFDLELTGSNDITFNSSSADLNLSSCANILFAGLYWGAGQGASGSNTSWITNETTCKIKFPGSVSYTDVTSTQTDYWNNVLIPTYAHTGYQCFADITSLIPVNHNGTYTVANVVGAAGIGDAYGGWTLVIAYGDANLPPQNLTVFDGCAGIKNGSGNVDVPIAGFLTPAAGPVSCELGAVVYDGDRVSQDGFQFRQAGAPSFYDMATTTIPLNGNADAWNSKISYKGTVVTNRNPNYQNTLGYDASIFNLPNAGNAQLSNSQTSATVRIFSNNENVIANVLTTAISQYNPSFAFDKTGTDINGGSLMPGDSIRYQINFDNNGNDSSTNTILLDRIPAATSFLPGSIRINGVPKTDAAGDDEAEFDVVNNRVLMRLGTGANASSGGNIGPGQSGNVQFDVVTTSSCNVISCTGTIRNQARISYNGKRSGAALYDSSGVSNAGCIVQGPVNSLIAGSCFFPRDTLLINQCNDGAVMLPWRRFAGYTFYSSMPFVPANQYDPYSPVTSSNVFWAHYTNGSGCADTARVQVIITFCPDIDDDNDGIPDYVEFDDPVALQDHNSNGIPNWNDAAYPGYVDNNSDGVNDNFDWGADADNDGTPNFQDTDFWKGWVDANNDGVNDRADKDQDGIPNQYDLDSDNDGIPDVVESYGVDTDGDGVIDNYTDTDNDGFSQNVDANNSGVQNSGTGLGAPDFDGDGIANYLDLDSDNDGIPDFIEAGGVDVDNDGKVDGFTDYNGNGLDDNHFMASALLLTGSDTGPADGRADDYPNKNKDRDFRPNAYDMDSDGDGITDVIEAGFADADFNGIVDGVIGSNGWSTAVSSLVSLTLNASDADPYPDYLDIDSDDDGIPDNIEGQSTAGYRLPVTADTDGDGLSNVYDNIVGFGGSGIYVYDFDGDSSPDYRDTDSDGDGKDDRIEGNDFNLNGMSDDNTTLTGLDDDGDGLDNRFDSLNSVIDIKGTSYMMGNLGSFTGDATPGSRTTVQRTGGWAQPDRDWRYSGFVLPVQVLDFAAAYKDESVQLKWTIIAEQELDRVEIERSTDNNNFKIILTNTDKVLLNTPQLFFDTDDLVGIAGGTVYYRLKVIAKSGNVTYSSIKAVSIANKLIMLQLGPNPAVSYVTLGFTAQYEDQVIIKLVNSTGKTVLVNHVVAVKGKNLVHLDGLGIYSRGIYAVQVFVNDSLLTGRLFLTR